MMRWITACLAVSSLALAACVTVNVYFPLDAGTAESEVLLDGVRRLRDLLETGGMPPERVRYVEEEGAEHHESHWGRRFRGAWPFLLGAESNDDEDRHHRGAGVVLASGLHRGSQPPE